jgi:hypothetical protein
MGDWPHGGGVCPECGETQVSNPETEIKIPLAFNIAVCDTCEGPVKEGRCPSCGRELDAVEPNAETRARVKALRPLLSRADELVNSFDEFPDPHIAVTAVQAVSLVTDAGLFDRARGLIRLAGRIGDFNLSDPGVIGRETRQRLEQVLDEVESVRDEARLLAAFRPHGSLEGLPRAVTALVSRGARVVRAIIDVISSETVDECSTAVDQLQEALDAGAQLNQVAELLDSVSEGELADDLDRRASIALGIDAKYTDELGFLDPVRIFDAPGDASQRLIALARGGGHYLSHLLYTPVAELPSGASVLAIFAVQLAILDRPFEPHRQAELARELLGAASTAASDDVRYALNLYDAKQGRVFAAGERARRELRELQLGRSDDPLATMESVLSAYKRISEGAYREQMRLLIAARQALVGRDPPAESLLLGDIDGYLEGWPDELGSVFRKAADRDLRNAIAHEEYEVDHDSLEVILPEGRLSPDELADVFRRLMGTVAALDAAIFCHRIDMRDVFEPPKWLISRDNSPARTMLLQMVAGAFGLELTGPVREADQILTLEIDGDVKHSFQDVGALLGSASKLSATAEVVRATAGAGGDLIAAVSTAALKRWDSADPVEQDLAMIEVYVDAARRGGADPADAIADACALAIRVLFKIDLEAALAAPQAHTPLDRLARRLRRAARFARQHASDFRPEDRQVAGDLREVSLLASAIVFDPDRLPELGFLMAGLFQWALARGTSLLGFELAE